MKIREIKEIRQKGTKELTVLLSELRKEIEKTNMDLVMKKLKNVSFVKEKKKDVARILTILKEKEDVESEK